MTLQLYRIHESGLLLPKLRYDVYSYKLNYWKELKRHSMVFGVLLVVIGAVVWPDIGANGGILHCEYSCYLPLTYIYVCAGWRCSGQSLSRAKNRGKLLTAGQAHAWVAPPLLAALFGHLFESFATDDRLLKGWQLAACGGGGAWLSIGLLTGASDTDEDSDDLALAVISAALGSALALPLLPLSHIIFCGTASLQPVSELLPGRLAATAGFAVGSIARWLRLRKGVIAEVTGVHTAVLCLLYAECCSGVRSVGGVLQPRDVLLAMSLVWSCLAVGGVALAVSLSLCGHRTGAGLCALFAAGGPSGSGRGLARLPTLLAAPARAAALAVMAAKKH